MKREKFTTRTITLIGELQVRTALALLPHLPIDAKNPLQLVIREEVKARKPDQNALMWAGPLKDIEEQAWVNGRQFKDVVWHEHFKELYLPDETLISREELATLVKDPDTYRKYDFTPSGNRVLVGSTTELTIKGFAQYLTQVEADGANMGVMFHANPNEMRRAA